MPTVFSLEKFEGPLDLLLQLIDQEELVITDIAIARVTEQYLKYLDSLEEYRSEELADFLVVATKLVYLKSKVLLPYLYPQEDEGPSLAEQLKLYKQYVEASKIVEGLWLKGHVAYGRSEPSVKVEGFILPSNAQAEHLYTSLLLVLKKLKPVNPLPKVAIDRTISLKHKIESIFQMLQQIKKLSFTEVVGGAESRTEIIVSFLAILELVKQQRVSIQQLECFKDMEVHLLVS
jgi:segregation and condensation protein A